MARPGTIIGWKLDPTEREDLLRRFPPRYPNIIADHVTLASDAEQRSLPPLVGAEIVGRTDDGDGVEAMVLAIDGDTGRPDGSTYHITWSLGPGRRARESNDVLAKQGWDRIDEAIPMTITPARF